MMAPSTNPVLIVSTAVLAVLMTAADTVSEHGFHEKDLEARICQQIKAGALDARSAFNRLTTDLVKFYDDVKPGHQSEHVE